MPTKISLALGKRRPLSRQTAWGCLTSNVALPGMGSLVAGRVSGYFQAALAISGMALTLIFGVRFIVWYVANWSKFYGPQTDPLGAWLELWLELRWALAGFGIFGIGWLWALGTSLGIIQGSRKTAAPPPIMAPGKPVS